MAIVNARATDGSQVPFVDQIIGAGGMKDVYFAPDKSYVVGFFRTKIGPNELDRITNISNTYRERIFNQAGGDYWKDVFCWPSKVVEYQGRHGIVAPCYQKHFFFEFGSVNNDAMLGIRGKEKEGKWFASAKNQQVFLDERERGDILTYIKICLKISRAVKRLHAAGLAHSDLSYKNVLIDPHSGNATIIDIDSLVVPGKYPPEVVGTPDFIAPEVMKSLQLKVNDPNKALPSIRTDCHALAVLNYMYLLRRHPLRGKKVHDFDDNQRDEALSMGEMALFIEHPTDVSNRPTRKWLQNAYTKLDDWLPWVDVDVLPYTVMGKYLEALFKQAFVDGLQNPAGRPTANEWETALVKTADLLQRCQNPACKQKWYVFANSPKPICPYCRTPYKGSLAMLDFYYRRGDRLLLEESRLMVFDGQSLNWWHADRNIFPNERLEPAKQKRVGYFQLHNGEWYLGNESLPGMKDLLDNKKEIPIGARVKLRDGMQILLSAEEGGRTALVKLVDC